MDENELINEFMRISKCNREDAISCLRAWRYDLKKALIDYNDTSTQNYFKSKTKTIHNDDEFKLRLNNSMDIHQPTTRTSSSIASHHDKLNSHEYDKNHDTCVLTSYRPLLEKSDSINLDYKKLGRGISRANDENVNLVTKVRKEFAMDFHSKLEQPSTFVDTPDYTFTLPDLTVHDEDFRKFLEKDLIECSTLNSLESSQRLNWWVESGVGRKVWPLSTSGDGNCLLHAASLAMWGFHDRRLTLRKALYNILSEGDLRNALYRRWRFQQTRINKEAGLVFSETEWAKEWDEIVSIASPESRKDKISVRRRSMVLERQSSLSHAESIDGNATYDSLEEIHVLALAYVLRRPIIILSDVVLRDINGDALAPITFGGVYLPLDIPQVECHKVPLLLAYDMAHFSALVTMEASSDFPPALIPLIDFENILLPLQFSIDPGEKFNWRDYDGREGNWALTEVEHITLLKEYLEIIYATPDASPEDEIYEDYQSDEEYDKKILDLAINLNNEENNLTGGSSSSPELEGSVKSQKSKSAKLQNVAKQFGSIGKSMSKKIKKNIGSITKFGKNSLGNGGMKLPSSVGNTTIPTLAGGYYNGKYRMLCAQLRAKRHNYQDEMIKNYLDCAYERFILEMKNKVRDEVDSVDVGRVVHCINSGCDNFGTEKTSWMCLGCYEKQKEQEIFQVDYDYSYQPPRYSTGNSKFYTQSDTKSHNVVKRLPSVKKLNELDKTLYLSKSTFFNDTKQSQQSISPSESSATAGRTTIIPMRVEGVDYFYDEKS
ncbi:CLUMA_CG002352, isoform A [Clunio marinus]|uniref:ubiquitinyl hydrolase 1 n=1 Tax=Clunio marinus TaxID=568069 RepID=A0A1J1HR17_9DIPT|nr:CLUMA_CG002352, isoform A [Clunio marinus]